MKISKLREIIRLMEEAKLSEIEISYWWGKIKLRKQDETIISSTVTTPFLGHNPSSETIAISENISEVEKIEAPTTTKKKTSIKSPMVGTFYRSPAPEAPPYVEIGDTVKVGQTVCIIEAMKLMNEIESDVFGRIVEILVEDGKTVEFGQDLMFLEVD